MKTILYVAGLQEILRGTHCRPRSRSWCARLHRVFTEREKKQLVGQVFREVELQRVDFSGADLRCASFVSVSLCGSDFSRADLRGTAFLECDLQGANFEGAIFSSNRFDRSWFIQATGLGRSLRAYIGERGGLLLCA